METVLISVYTSSLNKVISGKEASGVVDEIEKFLEGGYLKGAERKTPRSAPRTRAGPLFSFYSSFYFLFDVRRLHKPNWSSVELYE